MLRQTYFQLHRVGDRQDREYRVRWGDGSLHWLEGTNMVVGSTEDGDSIIQRTLIDITQRKILQQQLNQEQEMYPVAMESSADIMFEYLIDSDTFIGYEPRPPDRGEAPGASNSKLLSDKSSFIHRKMPPAMDNICNGCGESFEMRVVTPDKRPGYYQWAPDQQPAYLRRVLPHLGGGNHPQHPCHGRKPCWKTAPACI